MLSAYLVLYAVEKDGRTDGRTDDGVEKKEDNAQSRLAPTQRAGRRGGNDRRVRCGFFHR